MILCCLLNVVMGLLVLWNVVSAAETVLVEMKIDLLFHQLQLWLSSPPWLLCVDPMFLIGYSSPAQSGISADLGLTVAEYSLFGSILTIGAMIGAIASGKIADYLGRRCTMGISEIICI
nr:sugar transporter ERD6-like 5 isoform X2 [Ziziphus jujuba var. spinosa]